jgi:drug/metabolite transporter (DMT)-like permease
VSGVLLALFASVAWGTSDFLAGVESRRTTFWAAVLVSQPAALLGALIVLAIHAQGPPEVTYLVPAMFGGILSALAAFAQYRALVLVPMSLVSPLFAAAAIVPVTYGVIRGERPSLMQATGVVLTLAGIVLISRQGCDNAVAEAAPAIGPSADPAIIPLDAALDPDIAGATRAVADLQANPPADPPRTSVSTIPVVARSASVCAVPVGMSPARARREGILLALGAGLGFGLLLVAFDYGGDADAQWTVAAARITAVLVVLGTVGAKRPRLELRLSSALVLVLVGFLLVGANVLFTAASTRGYLSVVAVLGWLSPVFTVIYARVFLSERMRPLQLFAALMVFAGVACLAVG